MSGLFGVTLFILIGIVLMFIDSFSSGIILISLAVIIYYLSEILSILRIFEIKNNKKIYLNMLYW